MSTGDVTRLEAARSGLARLLPAASTDSRRIVFLSQLLLLYLFLYVPILTVIVLSFNDSRYAISWQGFTTRWWELILTGQSTFRVDPGTVWIAFQNTMIIAIVTVLVSTVIGTLLALGMDRYEFPGKSILTGVVYMPVIMPSIIMGISALIFFSSVGIETGLVTAIIAHIAFDISYIAIIVFSRLQSFDRMLEEAAYDLGASKIQTFRYVTLPLISPGILAGALLGFALSFDDFVITFFVIGTENTLPIYFFGMVRQGLAPGVNVIASIILISTMLLIGIVQWLQGPTW